MVLKKREGIGAGSPRGTIEAISQRKKKHHGIGRLDSHLSITAGRGGESIRWDEKGGVLRSGGRGNGEREARNRGKGSAPLSLQEKGAFLSRE